MDQPRSDYEQGPSQSLACVGGRTAVRAPVVVAVIVLAATVAVSALVWSVVRNLKERSSSQDALKQAATPESDSWRQRARTVHRSCLEVIRDLEPGIVLADSSPDSRDMRASWLRRAGASSREISVSAAELGAEATTDQGKAAARTVAASLSGLGDAAADLAGTMDDAVLAGRLASEQRKAEESLHALKQML